MICVEVRYDKVRETYIALAWPITQRHPRREGVEDVPFEQPNAGFYSFPSSKSLEEGFGELKACLIKEKKKEIERLQKSLNELEKLECPILSGPDNVHIPHVAVSTME